MDSIGDAGQDPCASASPMQRIRPGWSYMQTYPWTECFDFYFSSWHRAPLVVTVDLGAEAVAPLRSHPLRLQARIPMQRPRPDGLRDPSEAEVLFALEDALCEALGRDVPLLFVGRLVGMGEVTLVWYAPAVVRRMQAALAHEAAEVAGTMGAGTGEPERCVATPYEATLCLTEDPEWRFYFETLYPDVYNLQVMLNRRRLLTLQEHGDAGERPRMLEHRARFASAAQAEASLRALREAGFDAEVETGGQRVEVFFAREDVLARGRIDEVCIEILDAILPAGGHYEGWACPIVPE